MRSVKDFYIAWIEARLQLGLIILNRNSCIQLCIGRKAILDCRGIKLGFQYFWEWVIGSDVGEFF